MKDLEKRRDLLAVLLILGIVFLVQGSMLSGGKITGAVVGVPLEREDCFEKEYGHCEQRCIEKSQDTNIINSLPSDWVDSCINSCEKSAFDGCS